MADEKRISESRVSYETLMADLSEPIVIEREGQPVAVVVAYQQYDQMKSAAADNARRREEAWQRLDAILADVHSRPTGISSDEIESEITAAAQEVKEERRARHSRH